MHRLILVAVLASGVGVTAAWPYAEQPPKELVQYVRDAQKAGLSEQQIQVNAVNAGWTTAAIADAITYLRSPAPDKPAAEPVNKGPDGDDKRTALPPAGEPQSVAAPVIPEKEAPAVKPALEQAAPVSAAKPNAPNRGVPEDYHIGAGDVLHVSVWKEPDASVGAVVVRPDGKISMPMIKEIQVVGLTPTEAEKAITERLSKFINTADVTVIVSQINSKKLYLVGAVKKEGPMPYTYRMTVLQALSEAGGLTDYAKRKKIYVLRHENGRDYQFPFDYDAVLRGERMELNISLLPGDTLVVPK